MPAFIHRRAEHLLAKNPKMEKSTAFAIATQQGHALGKNPKKYGTKGGKAEAKAKYDKPKKEYVKTPNPGGLETPKLKPMKKKASLGSVLVGIMKEATSVPDSPYLLDQIGKEPKIRPTSAVAPKEKHRVKQAMIPSAGEGPGGGGIAEAAKKLQTSQKIGVPKIEQPKVKPLTAKLAFAVSQYSGTMGPSKFVNYASGQVPFRNPMLRNAGASNEELAMAQKEMKKKTKGWTPLTKVSAMLDELAKLNAIQSPEAQITSSQKVGAPKTTAPPGPSIAQIAKPVGFGRPQPGATKSGAI